jgi:hypothetical protein
MSLWSKRLARECQESLHVANRLVEREVDFIVYVLVGEARLWQHHQKELWREGFRKQGGHCSGPIQGSDLPAVLADFVDTTRLAEDCANNPAIFRGAAQLQLRVS